MNSTEESNVLSNISTDYVSTALKEANRINGLESNLSIISSIKSIEQINTNCNIDEESIDTALTDPKNLKDEFKAVSESISINENKNKKNNPPSYYCDITQYEGIVQELFSDNKGDHFSCILTKKDSEEKIVSNFDYDDIYFDSDKDLIKVGAQFILITGIKRDVVMTNDGPKLNGNKRFFDIYFRRIRNLNKKELEKANELLEDWTRILND